MNYAMATGLSIQHLQDRVDQLEQLIRDAGIEVPPEY